MVVGNLGSAPLCTIDKLVVGINRFGMYCKLFFTSQYAVPQNVVGQNGPSPALSKPGVCGGFSLAVEFPDWILRQWIQ